MVHLHAAAAVVCQKSQLLAGRCSTEFDAATRDMRLMARGAEGKHLQPSKECQHAAMVSDSSRYADRTA